MKLMKMMVMMTAVIALIAGSAVAQEEEGGATVSLSADLASSYVFRGVTFNDGLVLQPGVEVGGLPITFGVWANLDIDDYDGMLEEGQFSEIDLYASYDIPLELDILGLSVGYCEYTYPSGGGDADREISLSIGLDVPLSPVLDLYYGIDGGIEETFYVEASVGHEVALPDDAALELGALIGYVSPDGGEDGFSHYEVSVGLSWSLLSASIAYVGQIDDDVLMDYVPGTADADAALGYDVEVVAMVGIAADF